MMMMSVRYAIPSQFYGSIQLEPAEKGEQAGDNASDDRFLALTDRGLDVSNYVMAQFLL
jgi:hypothetical protein